MMRPDEEEALRRYVVQIERLAIERESVTDAIKALYRRAAASGIDTGVLKQLIAMRAKPATGRHLKEALLEEYAMALHRPRLEAIEGGKK